MPKEPLIAPELLQLVPKLGGNLTLPTWLLGGFLLVGIVVAAAFSWIAATERFLSPDVFLSQTRILLLVGAVCFAGIVLTAIWLLAVHLNEKSKLVAERQAFIVNQLTAFDSARDPTLVLHRSGRIELANLAAQSLFGHPRQEIHGKDISSLVETADTSSGVADRFGLSDIELKTGAVREAWGRASGGRRFPIEITIRNMAAANGERIGLFIRDVSERRAAQEALRKSEEQFRLLVNGVSDHALFMINPDGIVTNWNAGAERMSGYLPHEAIGQSVALFHTEEECEAGIPHALLEQARRDGRAESQGWRVRKDGSRFWAESILHTVTASDGELLGFAKITRDISERNRIEQLKDEFVSTVNHELRTPLTSIAGSLGLLAGGAGGELPPGAARLIGIAHANCQRLIRLINDMLDIEKIQSGKMRFELKAQSFADVARKCVESLRDYAAEPGVAIEFIAGSGVDVRADSDRITQVVTNLVSNAVKFSPRGGRVLVNVMPVGHVVRLCVRDEGPGIPDEFRTRIFSKFAQADSSDSRQKGGTGLGLVIAKEIVDRHGGRLWFESIPGQGASFFVDLPALVPLSAARPDAPAALVCEDDDDIALILTEILEKEGMQVERASTLAEARMALAGSARYTALILDLVLPDGDGVGLIRELRTRSQTQDLPVIVVSADAQRGRETRDANALNVVDWMDKPIEMERLQRAVQTALRTITVQRPLIQHVEDDHDISEVTASALRRCGEVIHAESLAEARSILAQRRPDLIILDIALGDGSGLELVPDLSRRSEGLIPVVIFSVQDTPDHLLLPQVKAVLTKSRTSLQQLAHTVQRLLGQDRAEERSVA